MSIETIERIERIAEAVKSAEVDGWFGVYEDDADVILAWTKQKREEVAA